MAADTTRQKGGAPMPSPNALFTPNDQTGGAAPGMPPAAQPTDFYRDDHPYYARRTARQLAQDAVGIVDMVRSTRASAGLTAMMRRHWYRYYGLDDGKVALSDTLTEDGEQGRRVRLRVNKFRAHIRRALNLTTQVRPAVIVKAKNTDEHSIKQTKIGKAILEHYFDSEGLYDCFDKAVEHSMILTAGFVHVEWDKNKGELFDVLPPTSPEQPSRNIMNGDFKFSVPVLFDIVFDHARQSWDDMQDVIVRVWTNRYDVAESFRDQVPDIDSQVEGVPNRKQEADSWRALPVLFFTQMDSVEIEVFTYYHKPTPSLPNGRMLKFLANGTVLSDDPLPYKCIPVFRIVQGEMIGTPQGHCMASDLAPVQEASDIIASAILTNQKAFGVQGILVPTGSNIEFEAINGGLGIIYYTPIAGPDGGKPAPLQLVQTPKEMFDHRALLGEDLAALSGINPTSQGNPPPGLDAGVAINLVQSASITFQDSLRKSLTAAMKACCYHMIETLRTNPQADLPRLVQLVGKTQREALVEFKGSQLEGIGQIVVDMGNPLEWTVAGRASIAKALVDAKQVRSSEEYLQVLNTGRLEPLTEADSSELNNIRSENEALMEGQPVMVMAGENHPLHIKEHLSLLANPEVRNNGEYAQGVMMHCNQHADAWDMGDRLFEIINGMRPPGMAMMPMGMPPPGAAPGAPPPGQPQGGSPPGGPQAGPPRPSSPNARPPGILPDQRPPLPPPAGP